MEYAATVWDPYTTDNIKNVEAVQRRAAGFVTGDYRYTSSVTAMTKSLSWETLQHRRQQAKAIMMFRIVHAMVAIPASPHLQLLGAATRGHQYKYRVPYCRTNTNKVSDCGTSCQKNCQTLNPLTPSRQGFQPPHRLPRCFYPAFNQSCATRHVYIVLINSATMLDSPV